MSRFLPALAAFLVAVGPALAQPAPKGPPAKRPATKPEDLTTLPGFKVELLYTADPATEGSWISLAKDNKGRLLIGGQNKQPILRATVAKGRVEKIENLDLPISEAMGLLYAFDSLYVMGAGPGGGYGLYRCRDTKGTDQFDDVKLLKNFAKNGEHGAHAVVLGPDDKIYVMLGNFVRGIDNPSPDSPHKNYQEDQLLPRQWDGNGHAAGVLAPGGCVVRTDPDGKKWDLVLGGFRNAYDMAFNADGELFTFDSDMEWDWGMPWYRPTRVNHAVTGGEYGWRSGSGVWPDYYPDSLPAAVNIGIGSPTGVVFGTGAKFPAMYQKALYVQDWSYGRIFAVHLTPNGATYSTKVEPFVAPVATNGDKARSPLPLTDLVIGDDGAMYFTIGGRNNQAALYRVTYTGSESTAPADLHDTAGAKERQLRHELEAFHGKTDPKAVSFAWPHLSSKDRYLRYAARIAIESQPVADWQDKALAETNPTAALTALLALSRCGDPKTQPAILAALGKLPFEKLTEEQKLDKLRVFGVCFARQGRPGADATRKLIAEFDPLFPSQNERLDRELSKMLIYLRSPGIAAKCLKELAAAKTVEDRIFYLFYLRTLPFGYWTMDQRKEYLSYYSKDRTGLGHPAELDQWFAEAGKKYSDGNSFKNFLKNFLREAAANMSDAERQELDPIITSINAAAVPRYDVKPRAVVKQWTMSDIEPKLPEASAKRDFNKGREAYLAAQCVKCHKFGDDGGSVGPDLTSVASRFDRRALLESIVEPSKVVSDQYQNEQFTTGDDQVVVGRVVDETPTSYVIQSNPLDPARVTIPKQGTERKPAKLSPMPDHLIDVLTADEVLDLIAFLESGGNKQFKAFR